MDSPLTLLEVGVEHVDVEVLEGGPGPLVQHLQHVGQLLGLVALGLVTLRGGAALAPSAALPRPHA